MSIKFCGCTRTEIITAHAVNNHLIKLLRCKDCGATFSEDEELRDLEVKDINSE